MEDAHHLINDINKYFKCSIDWEGHNYLGLTLDCNYTKSTFISPCLDTSQLHCINSSTNHQHAPKTNHIHGINLFIANTYNYPLIKYPHQNSTLQTQTDYNSSTAPLYSIPKQYTQPYFQPSMKYPPDSLHQLKTQWVNETKY